MEGRQKGWRTFEINGFEILVGRAARDNDHLTFKVARPQDTWLHASGYSGSHVVIRQPEDGGEIPREVLQQAAQLAAWHSKGRDARGKIAVHMCRAADVRKAKGAPAGQVELKRWEEIRVYPRKGAAGTERD